MTTKLRRSTVYLGEHSYWRFTGGMASSISPPGVPSEGHVYYDGTYVFVDNAIGGDDSAWRQKVAMGLSAQHAYTRTAVRLEDSASFSAHAERTTDPSWFQPDTQTEDVWGLYSSVGTLSGSADVTAVNRAKSNFVSKASAAVTSFQGGTFIGELREAIETIRHPCEGVKRLASSYLLDLKKSRAGFKKATKQRRQRHIASQWLEVSYGIRPLLADIHSACQAASDIVNQRANSPTLKGFGKARAYLGTAGSDDAFKICTLHFKGVRYVDTKVVFYGAVRQDLGQPSQFILDKLGLNLPNFLPTVWELIPYSFLADYFTNVGQFVQALSFPTSRLAWSGSTTLVKSHQVVYLASVTLNAGPGVKSQTQFSPGKTHVVRTTIDRAVSPSLVPSLQVHIPSGVEQWTNMLALAVQAKAITPY